MLAKYFQLNFIPIRLLSAANTMNQQWWIHCRAIMLFGPKLGAHFLHNINVQIYNICDTCCLAVSDLFPVLLCTTCCRRSILDYANNYTLKSNTCIICTFCPSFSGHSRTTVLTFSCQISSHTSVLVASSGDWAATKARHLE